MPPVDQRFAGGWRVGVSRKRGSWMKNLGCVIADKQFRGWGVGTQGRRAAACVRHTERKAMAVSTLWKMLQYQRIAPWRTASA